MKKFVIFFAAAVLLMGFSGCSHFFYPRADDFAEKAKGASTIETLLNLTTMMEASAQASKGGSGMDQPFDDLHNQLHAFNDTLCCVEEDKRKTPDYDLAVTHNKELWTIFKRLWKFKDTQPQRDSHLDLFMIELREVRTTLEALKTY